MAEPADFSQPGSDGALPSGFIEWQRGVTYTVRPEMLFPLVCGREYRLTASVRRKTAKGEPFTAYADLYQRASAIADARIAELICADEAAALHRWIVWHGWRSLEAGPHQLLFAFLTIGLVWTKEGDPKPRGENAPTPAELVAPGGATLEELQRVASQRSDEIYIDFDHRDLACANPDIVMFSYGEYSPACERINFEPFVQGAENRARFHYELFKAQCSKDTFRIVRREWLRLTDPYFAVVNVYYEA